MSKLKQAVWMRGDRSGDYFKIGIDGTCHLISCGEVKEQVISLASHFYLWVDDDDKEAEY